MQIYEEVSVYQFVFYTMFFGTDSLRDEINCKTIFISMQIRPQKFLSKRYQKTDYEQRPKYLLTPKHGIHSINHHEV